MKDKSKFRFGMFLVTIGIVYGDIGTSPMYVMKSILEGNGGITQINEAFIIGSLSLVIWTITLLTTVKYVLIAMKADNHGEGGIFSLFSLVRGCGKWLIVPAMLGGAALLADGVLTPAVTVTTAVEGLRSMEVMDRFLGTGQVKVVVITLIIITALFSVQHAGTSRIGKAFGLLGPARRHQPHRQGLRPGHAALVLLPRHHGGLAYPCPARGAEGL